MNNKEFQDEMRFLAWVMLTMRTGGVAMTYIRNRYKLPKAPEFCNCGRPGDERDVIYREWAKAEDEWAHEYMERDLSTRRSWRRRPGS